MRFHLLSILIFFFAAAIPFIKPFDSVSAQCIDPTKDEFGNVSCPPSKPICFINQSTLQCCTEEECKSQSEIKEGELIRSIGRIGKGGGLGPFADIVADLAAAGAAVEKVFSVLLGLLTIIGGLWFMIQFVVGGLNWISAGGDSKKLEEARNRITSGLIGLIIIVAAWAIIGIAGTILGLDILNPANIIKNLQFGAPAAPAIPAGPSL